MLMRSTSIEGNQLHHHTVGAGMKLRPVSSVALAALVLAGCASSSHLAGPSGTTPTTPVPTSTTRPLPVAVDIVLPRSTLRAGSTMAAHAVVVNRTGHALHLVGCGSIFQVALTSPTYEPVVVWAACASAVTVPVGRTTYPVRVDATYFECTNAMLQPGIPACRTGGSAPPLPAGDYRATLYQSPHIAPQPPSVPVRVLG
jgi:hypothetical protein